jgi:hypothetical protein
MPPPDKDLGLPQVADLVKLTVPVLKQFLKVRGVRSSGKKSELVKLATLYYLTPILRTEPSANESSIFTSCSLVWEEVKHRVHIPSSFSIEVLTSYLATVPVCMVMPHSSGQNEDGGEPTEGVGVNPAEIEVDAGTEKPAAKGRRMYVSEKLTLVEVATSGNTLLFRGNCEASLRKSCRYPAVAISNEGKIVAGQCNCPAQAGMLIDMVLLKRGQLIKIVQSHYRWSLLPCSHTTLCCRGYLTQSASSCGSSLHLEAPILGPGQPSPTQTRTHLPEQVFMLHLY